MSGIAAKFEELHARREGALIAFVTAGDPTADSTPEIVKTLESAGANMVELGLPFSDPIADGPTIQAASERALRSGMNTDAYFAAAEKIRKKVKVPLICLTYFNPVLRRGIPRFMNDCARSGMEGLIIPDLPVEEAKGVMGEAEENGVDLILLATPATTEERMRKIVGSTRGFLYLVSLLGVTGARRELSTALRGTIRRARKFAKGDVPIAVGFGISAPEHVREVISAGADGAIVGSAIVELIAENSGNERRMLSEVRRFVAKLKEATRT